MSKSVSLDLEVSGTDVSASRIVSALLGHGWKLGDGDEILVLPLGDNGAFAWQSLTTGSEAKVLALLEEKRINSELAGVVVTWPGGTGGELLLRPNGELSFVISINRRVLEESRATDVSWYLERLLPPLVRASLEVICLTWTEHA